MPLYYILMGHKDISTLITDNILCAFIFEIELYIEDMQHTTIT